MDDCDMVAGTSEAVSEHDHGVQYLVDQYWQYNFTPSAVIRVSLESGSSTGPGHVSTRWPAFGRRRP